MASYNFIIFALVFGLAVTLPWTIKADPSVELLIREKRWTCDVIGWSRMCALHCKVRGFYTGYCEKGICRCRSRNK
ncbi:hypothetical protein CHUAL_006865 [Chamberlinius hualienensis]